MERRAFQTPLGEIVVWGPITVRPNTPAVLMIGGAFQSECSGYQTALPEHVPDADLFFVHLPGNHCPELREVSVVAYARAFDYFVQTELTGRPVVVLGVSFGGAVAFAMRAPEIKRLLVIDPPLCTAKAWPLEPVGRAALARRPESWVRPFVQNVMGVYETHVEERDYLSVALASPKPAVVLVPGEPLLPRREIAGLPSLLDEPEREALSQRPRTQLITVPDCGHELHGWAVLDALQQVVGFALRQLDNAADATAVESQACPG